MCVVDSLNWLSMWEEEEEEEEEKEEEKEEEEEEFIKNRTRAEEEEEQEQFITSGDWTGKHNSLSRVCGGVLSKQSYKRCGPSLPSRRPP